MAFKGSHICAVQWLKSGNIWGVSKDGVLYNYVYHAEDSTCSKVRTIEPTTDLGFEVSKICTDPKGKFAVLTGSIDSEAHLAVADLGGDETRKAYKLSSGDLLLHCPGVYVLKVRWAPSMAHHFAVLVSNNRWGIYDVREPGVAEQVYKLEFSVPPGWKRTCGMAVSFDFCPGIAWGRFAVVFLKQDHTVFIVCPVVVPGLELPKAVLAELKLVPEWRRWCWDVFPFETKEKQVAHKLPNMWTQEPALQGPLNCELCPWPNRVKDPAVDIIAISCAGVIVVYTITSSGVLSGSILDGDVEPKMGESPFCFDFHKPMLAPEIVFREVKPSVHLKTVSRAILGKERSGTLQFLVHPTDDDLDWVIVVIRENGIFIVQHPFLRYCLEGALGGESENLDDPQMVEPPVITHVRLGKEFRSLNALTGIVQEGNFFAAFSTGPSIVVTSKKWKAKKKKETQLCQHPSHPQEGEPCLGLECSSLSSTIHSDSFSPIFSLPISEHTVGCCEMKILESWVQILTSTFKVINIIGASMNVVSNLLHQLIHKIERYLSAVINLRGQDKILPEMKDVSGALQEKFRGLDSSTMSQSEVSQSIGGLNGFVDAFNSVNTGIEGALDSTLSSQQSQMVVGCASSVEGPYVIRSLHKELNGMLTLCKCWVIQCNL